VNLIENISQNWKELSVNYEDLEYIALEVPRNPGIYQILTNAPKELLVQFGRRTDKKHYNLEKKIRESDKFPKEFKIIQQGSSKYIVYTGHSYNLRQRFKEHFKGSKGTGCLALFQIEKLRNFEWDFHFNELGKYDGYFDSKLQRTFLEQKYRATIGWPILCSQ
jgi:hypothetical protein